MSSPLPQAQHVRSDTAVVVPGTMLSWMGVNGEHYMEVPDSIRRLEILYPQLSNNDRDYSVWLMHDEFCTSAANLPAYLAAEIAAVILGAMAPIYLAEPVLAPESPPEPKPKAEETPSQNTPPSTHDPVHPRHYDVAGGLDLLDVMPDHLLRGFCLGNVLKYVLRAGRKEGASTLEDLRKAREYLDRAIERLEAQ